MFARPPAGLAPALCLTRLALAPARAANSEDQLLAVRVQLPAGEVDAHDLAERWAKASKRQLIMSEQAEHKGSLLRLKAPRAFSPGEVHELLRRRNLRAVETESLIQIFTKHELEQASLPDPVLVEGDAPLPRLCRPVLLIQPLRHRSGSSIYANLRGLLNRETGRYGQVMYVEGVEVLLLEALSPTVRRLRELIQGLDRPARATPSVSAEVYLLPRERWQAISRQPTLELAATLAKESQGEASSVRCLERTRVVLNGGGQALWRRFLLEERPHLLSFSILPRRLAVEVQREGESGQRLGACLRVGLTELDAPRTLTSGLGAKDQLVVILRPVARKAAK